MKVVFKKSTTTLLLEKIDNEVYRKNLPDSSVECLLITEEEAWELFKESRIQRMPFAFYGYSKREACEKINKSKFAGFEIRVEGFE